jgi:hypothetical protein
MDIGIILDKYYSMYKNFMKSSKEEFQKLSLNLLKVSETSEEFSLNLEKFNEEVKNYTKTFDQKINNFFESLFQELTTFFQDYEKKDDNPFQNLFKELYSEDIHLKPSIKPFTEFKEKILKYFKNFEDLISKFEQNKTNLIEEYVIHITDKYCKHYSENRNFLLTFYEKIIKLEKDKEKNIISLNEKLQKDLFVFKSLI